MFETLAPLVFLAGGLTGAYTVGKDEHRDILLAVSSLTLALVSASLFFDLPTLLGPLLEPVKLIIAFVVGSIIVPSVTIMKDTYKDRKKRRR